jgi:hypothetical protein
MNVSARRRLVLACLLLATVALGVITRRVRLGSQLWDKSTGDALYAVAAYLGIAFLLPRAAPHVVAGLVRVARRRVLRAGHRVRVLRPSQRGGAVTARWPGACKPSGTVAAFFAGRPPEQRWIYDAIAKHLATLGKVLIDPVAVCVMFKRTRELEDLGESGRYFRRASRASKRSTRT